MLKSLSLFIFIFPLLRFCMELFSHHIFASYAGYASEQNSASVRLGTCSGEFSKVMCFLCIFFR